MIGGQCRSSILPLPLPLPLPPPLSPSVATLFPSTHTIPLFFKLQTPTKPKRCLSYSRLRLRCTHTTNNPAPNSIILSQCTTSTGGGGRDFLVVNFYRFVFIRDPDIEVAKHISFLRNFDIHGRIYMNEQGINAQYSGPSKDALAYVEWLKKDDRFSGMLVQISSSPKGHAFPKLKLRYKSSLVQLEGGTSHLPLLDPSMRAKPLSPCEWRKKLEAADDVGNALESAPKTILLDLRNGYEWDIGHFHGARRPDVDCFRSTAFGLSQGEVTISDPLAYIDKEKTDVLMYCTGGIRCDVYSTILRKRGFQNLYTLKGGVSHYLEKVGPANWVGNLFVFDSRLSLSPSPSDTGVITETKTQASMNSTFARCYVCDSQVQELRHRNCANIDCNHLYLCCSDCVERLRGCCCLNCTTAIRLRPVLPEFNRYEKWHVYRDIEMQSKLVYADE